MSQSNVVVTGPSAIEGTYKNIVLKSGIGFEEQTREGYCIYHVKWNYDLGGAVVDIPANTVISMEGGVISNGTLVGHDTQIIYDVPVDKAFVNVELEGTWIDDDDKQDARISELERISGNRAESTVLPTHMGRVTLKPNVIRRDDVWFVYPYTFIDALERETTINILVYYKDSKYYLPFRNVQHPKVINITGQGYLMEQKLDEGTASVEDIAAALDLQEEQYMFYDDDDMVITMPDSSTVNAWELANDNWPFKNYTETDANILTQQMISKPNTIYVIQYDYELAEDITVPENCMLEFDGGSVSGVNTIIGNNTGIVAGLIKVFNTDIILDGTWNITEAYPEWFGAVKYSSKLSDDSTSVDSREAIQKCLNSFNLCILSGIYYIKSYSTVSNYISASETENIKCGIVLWQNMVLRGCDKLTTLYSKDNIALVISSDNIDCQIGVAYKYCTKMLNFVVEGNLGHEDFSRKTIGVSSFNDYQYYQVTRVWISGVSVSKFYYGIKGFLYLADFCDCQTKYTKYGFYLEGLTATTLKKCYALSSVLAGIYITNSQYSTLIACCSDGQGKRIDGTNIPIPSGENQYAGITVMHGNTISLVSCGTEGCKGYLYTYNTRNINMQMHSTMHPEIDYDEDYFSNSFYIDSSSGKVELDIYSQESENHYERYRCINVAGLNTYHNNGVLNLSVTGRNINSEIFDALSYRSSYEIISKQLEYSFNGAKEKSFEITDASDLYIINTDKTVIKSTINISANSPLDWRTPHNFIVDFSKATKVHVKANDTKIIYIYSHTYIIGFEEVVFENILFRVSDSSGDGVFGLIDTNIVFKNCVFQPVSGTSEVIIVDKEVSSNYKVEQIP